jgi:hypothetical protein
VLVGATALRAGANEWFLLAVGGLGLVVLLGGLVLRWSGALAVGVALLGAQQAVRLELGPDRLDTWIPLVAGALLLVAELAWWSIEARVPAWSAPWLPGRRLVTILVSCAGATAVAGVVAVAGGAQLAGGFGLELLGIAAAAAAVAVVAFVARSKSAVD